VSRRYILQTIACIIMLQGSQALGGPTWVQVTESMIASVEDMSLILVADAGFDAASLQFTCNVDPVSGAFSYSLNSSQTYQGLAFSLSTSATFDSSLGQYDWTTTGQLGSATWNGNGSITWTPGDPPDNTNADIGDKNYAVTSAITYDDNTMKQSDGKFTVFDNGKQVGGPYDGRDMADPQGGGLKYDFIIPGTDPLSPSPAGAVIFCDGVVPPVVGGAGNFQITISSVPEPSSLLMASIGLAAQAGYCVLRKARVSRR
jgi:hypothetical protein